ncbi:MAG: DUF2510 domain-containing protein [Coriobacteriales bacterium]|jgi:hypothetical protein|nr:DUF2510 domain-containing protein [Coriobacteriales bacterium]
MADDQIPAGWYPDPAGDTTQIRYWDGKGWTEQTQPSLNPELRDVGGVSTQPTNVLVTPQPVYAPGQDVSAAYTKQPQSNGRGGMAVAALVLGIIGVPTCMCYGLSVIPGALALVFGILSVKSSRKGMAIAGIICGVIAIILGISFIIMMVVVYPDILANPERYGLTQEYIDALTT